MSIFSKFLICLSVIFGALSLLAFLGSRVSGATTRRLHHLMSVKLGTVSVLPIGLV